ncbi:TRAP-type C4-dicarboxylate transport system, substrate-binding protein [Palleronia marisminoris]|uniref:Sialic acid-binding periplasmic protein SiaP n=1 Tax=Palleronia marisminoris TaxID=315423 RepID=A0A1Y5RTF6_9RHOB|nr:TRAP transporter substrate-binding protein [Palleronia marisminoris]SFG52434.1 TRAP-type C4-dicarboxylate transport system, substrate-binding protein [Palleronia marisminoris]SLN23995.1 Sialic acid-binding periplasmic protein SiaP precursor [Palleronia marisminoris]
MSFKALALGASLSALMAGAVNAQEHQFTLHHFLGPQAPAHTQMLEPWARQVEENSGGQVAIEIFPSMTLGGRPQELVGQVRDGVVDMAWTLNGYTPGLFPRTEVFELPTVYENDPAAANLAMREVFDEHLAEEYQGLEVMFLHVHAGQGIHTGDIEARAPSDLEGTSLRIPSRSGSWVIEALGAQPVAMPVPELPQALQKGVVDGALIPWEIIPALKIFDQTEYQIEGPNKERLGTSVFQVSMNQGRWDGLPEDIKQAFRDASGEDFLREMGEVWRQADENGIAVAVENGNTHIQLTEEEWSAFEEAVAPVVERWTEETSGQGIDGQALAETARNAIEAAQTE